MIRFGSNKAYFPENQNQKDIDTNIISIEYHSLLEPPNDPYDQNPNNPTNPNEPPNPQQCKCGSILTPYNEIEYHSTHHTWKCLFCRTTNDFPPNETLLSNATQDYHQAINTTPETLRKTNSPNPTPSTKTTSNTAIKPSHTNLIYCIDISGSMEGKELETVQKSILTNFETYDKQPSCPMNIGLVLFESKVYILNDCTTAPITISDERLKNYETMLKYAQENQKTLQPYTRTKSELKKAIEKLEAKIYTAIGPGLLYSVVQAGSIRGSKVVLCTDGRSEGGSFKNYEEITQLAISMGVVINIMSIKECDKTNLELTILGECARKTQGDVEIMNHNSIVQRFSDQQLKTVVATNVVVRVFLQDLFRVEYID